MTKINPVGPELLWPYPVIWLADHWVRDYQEFMGRLCAVKTPQEIAEAESSLGEHCARDMMTAWADLWLIPLKVLGAAAKAAEKPA